MNERGTLVIGLGEAGVRVKRQTAARWEQICAYEDDSAPFGAVSVSLLPDDSPDHIRISPDVDQARQMFGDPLPPYIRAWADPAGLNVPPNGALTRAQARLLWFASAARGSNDPLTALWTRQIQALANVKSLAIFLIADLNETFASAIVADAVYLTRTLAAREHLKVTLWAFTILPAPNAPHAAQMGGYAALRELSRLTVASDNELGYPFVYRAGHDEPITQGRLREKPFDLWYCFEGAQAEAELSALVSAFLYEQSFSEAATFAANLSVNTRKPDPLGVYISTGNARTLALPVTEYVVYATAQNRRSALEWLLTPPSPVKVGQMVEIFLSANPSLRGRRMVSSLKEIGENVAPYTQEARLDEWLLNNQSLAGETFGEDSRQLRAAGMAFEVTNPETLAALRRVVERVGRPVTPRGASTPSAYDQFVTMAAERHSRDFEAYLSRALADWLNSGSGEESRFARARAMIGALAGEIQAIGAAFEELLKRRPTLEKDAQLHYSAFDSAARKLEQHYLDFDNPVQRLRHARELRAAQMEARNEAAAYLTSRRLLVLIDAANRVIAAQIAAVTRANRALAQWEAAFRSGLAAAQAVGAALPVMPTLCWVVPSLDDAWLEGQRQMAVSRSSQAPWHEQIGWQVDGGQITLVTPQSAVQPDDLRPLWDLMDSIYADFHRSATLLRYLQETAPARWLPYLAEAEQASLRVHSSVHSMAVRRGRLYAPASDYAAQRQLPDVIINDLNRAHGRDAANRSVIDMKMHGETDRLTYACSTDNIELQSEVITFGALADYADKHGAALESFHVLSADREAVRLARLIGRTLTPAAAALLYDIERLRWFWIAYCLNLMGEEKQSNGYLAILFALPDSRSLLLTRPRPTQAQAWRSAIAAFVAAHEAQGAPVYLPIRDSSLADTGALAGLIGDVWDAAGSSIDVDSYVKGDAEREAWLARARDVITPKAVQEQIEHSVVRHAMLDGFLQDVERGRAAFAEDHDAEAAVLVDLYDVGIALLKEQQRAIKDQILSWIARLPGGTLNRR